MLYRNGQKWLLNLNIDNCQVVTFRRSVDKSYKYSIGDCNNQTMPLEGRIQVLDIGVCFDDELSFKEHFHAKINKAYMMLELIIATHSSSTVLKTCRIRGSNCECL